VRKESMTGWIVVAGAHALWPTLIAASFIHMPSPFSWLSAVTHAAAFLVVGVCGVSLILPGRNPFNSPLPSDPERDFPFRAASSGTKGEVQFCAKKVDGKKSGGSANEEPSKSDEAQETSPERQGSGWGVAQDLPTTISIEGLKVLGSSEDEQQGTRDAGQ